MHAVLTFHSCVLRRRSMPADDLHNHKQCPELVRIVAEQKGIDPALVEKDYWIMHCLYGLQKLDLTFELKGGTSLSKGFKMIVRFSEDIDPPRYGRHRHEPRPDARRRWP